MAHALGEELEKFLRFEIGCEERANSTIFSAHQSEELWKWQEKKRGQSGGNASKEGWRKRGMEQGKGLGRVQHTVAAYIGKGGLHS